MYKHPSRSLELELVKLLQRYGVVTPPIGFGFDDYRPFMLYDGQFVWTRYLVKKTHKKIKVSYGN